MSLSTSLPGSSASPDEKTPVPSTKAGAPDKTLQVALDVEYLATEPLQTIACFSVDSKSYVRAAPGIGVSPELMASYILDDSVKSIRIDQLDKESVLVSPEAKVVTLPDGSIVHQAGSSVRLVNVGNKIQAESHGFQHQIIFNIFSANQDEYLVHSRISFSRPTRDNPYPPIDATHPEYSHAQRVFLIPKNKLADWINQHGNLKPVDFRVTELHFPEGRDNNKVLAIPKDNIIVWYLDRKLSVFEIIHNELGAELMLVWADRRTVDSSSIYPNILNIRPGFFAVTTSVSEPSQPWNSLIEEWDLEEILRKAQIPGVCVKPHRSSILKIEFSRPNYRFLEDGRSVVVFANGKALISDLERREVQQPEEVVVCSSEQGFLRHVSYKPNIDNQYFIANNVWLLFSISKVSFPLSEKRCREIPEMITASCQVPREITAIITHGYLGMFSKKTQNKETAQQNTEVVGTNQINCGRI